MDVGYGRLFSLSVAGLLGACTPDPMKIAQRSVDSGEAIREVQHLLDDRRQCARLFSGIEPLFLYEDQLDDPGPRALIAAGVVVKGKVLPDRPSAVALSAGPAARGDVKLAGQGKGRLVYLCYAKRQVTRVWLKPDPYRRGQPTLGYAFRLVAPSPWVRDARVRSGYPFLREAFRREHIASERVALDDGHWAVKGSMNNMLAPDVREGF